MNDLSYIYDLRVFCRRLISSGVSEPNSCYLKIQYEGVKLSCGEVLLVDWSKPLLMCCNNADTLFKIAGELMLSCRGFISSVSRVM